MRDVRKRAARSPGAGRSPGWVPRRALRTGGVVFSAVGVLILLFALYELVGTTAITKRNQSALRREFRAALAAPARPESPGPAAPPRRVKTGAPLARLLIAKIHVDVIIVQGVSRNALAKGPGHYPGTPGVGAAGSTGIAGHRTGWGAPFFNLDLLSRGDRVVLQTKTATYTYRVTRKAVVHPDDVWVLSGDPRSRADFRLTLTTCTPRFTARDRLIVWADLVRTVPRSEL